MCVHFCVIFSGRNGDLHQAVTVAVNRRHRHRMGRVFQRALKNPVGKILIAHHPLPLAHQIGQLLKDQGQNQTMKEIKRGPTPSLHTCVYCIALDTCIPMLSHIE